MKWLYKNEQINVPCFHHDNFFKKLVFVTLQNMHGFYAKFCLFVYPTVQGKDQIKNLPIE